MVSVGKKMIIMGLTSQIVLPLILFSSTERGRGAAEKKVDDTIRMTWVSIYFFQSDFFGWIDIIFFFLYKEVNFHKRIQMPFFIKARVFVSIIIMNRNNFRCLLLKNSYITKPSLKFWHEKWNKIRNPQNSTLWDCLRQNLLL